jgi:RND family efflux transporter MFP subunit
MLIKTESAPAMNPGFQLLLLASLFLLAACSGDKPADDAATQTLASESAAAASNPGQPVVSTQPLSAIALRPERDAPAQVISANESRLSAEISARIVALPVDVGQVVARGALVAKLDDRDVQLDIQRAAASLDQARARMSQAKAQLDRARRLQAENFLSPEALTQRETDLAVVEADLRAAQTQLDVARRALTKTAIHAPFDAIVRARHAQLGELAAPGTALLTLIDRSRLEVSAQVQTQSIADLKAASAWRFVAAGQEAPIRLLRVSPAVSREARTVESRFAFTGQTLSPGLEGRIVWQDNRLHLPAHLLAKRGSQFGVFSLNDGKAVFNPLPDAQEGRPAVTALPADTPIIVEGWQTLQDGQAVVAGAAASAPAN